MSEESKLISGNNSDSTHETKPPIARPRIRDSTDVPKTRAWGGEEQEIVTLPTNGDKKEEVEETSFSHLSPITVHTRTLSGGISPTRSSELSSPARSDTEFIKKQTFAPSPKVFKQQPAKVFDDNKREGSSGKVSEISSIRSGTPGSDGKSYREQIRERVQAAKDRALAAGTLKQRVSKPKSPSGSRSDEFDREEDKIEEAMKKHRQFKSKWKVATSSVHVANIQSGYEFFSKGWEAPVKSPSENDDVLKMSKEEGESTDDEKMMVADMLGSHESDWMPLYSYQQPEPSDSDKVKEKNIGLFFCPSTSPVPLEEKLEPETPPRFMEDEGLHIGKRTKVSLKTRNKLEQRIMAMGSDRFWFGEDGEIKGIPDPLVYTRTNINFDAVVPADFQVEYVPAKIIEPGSLSVSGNDVYLLQIEVGLVSFRHHPLFSKEHCLGEKLRSLCESKESPANRLGGRLQALRNSRNHLLKLYSVSKDDQHLARANKQRSEIKEVRSDWLMEKRKERERLTRILETWRDLKHTREKQGYTSSSYKLRIMTREEENYDWESQYNSYLDEVLEEAEEEYKSDLKEYKEKYENWKKRKEKKKDEGMSSEEDILSQSDDDGLEPVKPKKPKKSKLEQYIRDELILCLRPPGEPLIEIQLLDNADISPTTDNAMEEERRKVTRNCQISVVLQVNGKQVDKAIGLPFSEKFTSEVSHRFSLKLQSQPSCLSLLINDHSQSSLFGKKPIAQIYVPIPGNWQVECYTEDLSSEDEVVGLKSCLEITSKTIVQRVHADCAEWCDYEFSSGERIGPFKHTGVGCGQLELNVNEERTLYTSGLVSVRAGWADPVPNIFPQPKSNKVMRQSRTNVQKLKEWADQVQLDPNDPNNADLFEYLKTENYKTTEKDNFLNLMEFCSEDEIFNNPRLKLLLLRQSGQPEFRAMRLIPMNEREIPKDIFRLYEKRISGRKKKLKGGTIDQERTWAKEFIEQIKEDVLKKSRLNLAKTFSDMVHEEPVPDLGTLGLTFMKWLQPKRPLRPKRKQRKKFPVKSLVGQQLEIIVNIGRAFEVPVRKDSDEKNEQGFTVVPVRPFIEVVFQGERRRTNTAEGANPTWNQDLHIPIDNPHGDFNPSALQSLKESIHIHLYDEKLVDIIDDDRLRETNIHQRLEKHWLASLRIPFAALYSNSRIEGTFQMYSPPVLLGYERESKEFRDSTFLTVFLIVHPPLHPPSPLQEKLQTSEELYVEQHLDQWLIEVRKIFPQRHVPSLVMDSSGKSVCVTRYFKPINPPEMDTDMKTTPEMAARFVSLIPVIPGNLLYPGYLDIWLTADQLLGLGVCESCSAAVLLCCFLRALELQSWLLVGCGRSSGPAMFVLTKSQQGEMTVWDPSTGRSYPTSHPFSPLYRIYCLIDDSNIWVNNQKDDLMSSASLDVSKRSDWWPAFGRSVGAPMGTVQPNSLLYKPTQEVKTLEGRLEKILRNAIMKLRPTHRTVWNRYCAAALKKLLPGLERAAWSGEGTSTIDHIQELQHILSSYKMCGFPINLPYNSPSEIVDAVKSTGVHLNDAPEIEFSVAVYIHSFPNNVLSVWVYVASLIRRRS